MTQPSRIGHVKVSQSPQRLHVPSYKLPVVIVPDIFGTRLTDTDSTGLELDLTWNPRGYPFRGDVPGSPGPFVIDVERLKQITNPLDPDTRHMFAKKSDRNKVLHITNYYNMVPEWYHTLATAIADMGLPSGPRSSAALKKCRVYPRVYIAGYDWRLDNARSALRLASVIDQALRETGAQQVVVVGHGMGGQVALYYSRCLGGEERIARLILVGTGLLGIPDAYQQLKNGLGGFYSKAYRDNIESMATRGATMDNGGREMLWEGLSDALNLADAAASATSPADFAEKFFGGLYLKLCVGSGKMLSRDDTRTWARHLTSLYQLMPTATYCRTHWNWLIFDPSATGYPAAGYMLVTPTLTELLGLAVMGPLGMLSGAKGFDDVMSKVDDLLEGRGAEQTSSRARRNMDTLVSFFTTVFSGDKGVGSDDDDVAKSAINKLKGFFSRFKAIFVDCRNPRTLYLDIYTGLTDVAEQRGLCAGNVALARRFDDALTIKARPELPASGATLIKLLGKWINAGIAGELPAGRADALNKALKDNGGDLTKNETLDKQDATKDDWDEEFRKPRIYLHPNTVAIYGIGRRCPHPGLLMSTAILSNDDSNVVLWRLLTNPLSVVMGDGMVPADSANPPPAPGVPPPRDPDNPSASVKDPKPVPWINRPFKHPPATVSGVDHRDLCNHPSVITFVMKSIEEVASALPGGG